MKSIIDMAREAGYMRTVHGGAEVSMASMDCLKAFEALVRADAIADERARIIAENELVIERVNGHIDHLNAAILAEREACAKVCVKIALEFKSMYCGDEMESALICEKTIRARGETK